MKDRPLLILCNLYFHSLAIRFPYAALADLVKVAQAINREDMLRVQEFTTVLDRCEPQTVGIIFESTDNTGMASSLRSATLHGILTWLA